MLFFGLGCHEEVMRVRPPSGDSFHMRLPRSGTRSSFGEEFRHLKVDEFLSQVFPEGRTGDDLKAG